MDTVDPKEGDVWAKLDKSARAYVVAAGPKRIQYRIIPSWRLRSSRASMFKYNYQHLETRPDPDRVWEGY